MTEILLRQVPRFALVLATALVTEVESDLGITSKIETVGHLRVLGGPGACSPGQKLEI